MLVTFRRSFAAATLALTAVTPALAGDISEPRSVIISEPRSVIVTHADLDLATTAGAARLEARVRHAATRVCGRTGRDLAARDPIAACRESALANARPTMALAIASARGNTQLARNDRGVAVSAR